MAAVERKRSNVVNVKRTQAIELRVAGYSQDAVAERMGITQQRVSQLEREWLAEREPSAEVTEQRRQMQLAGIDAVRSKLFDALAGETEMAVRLAVVDRLDKLWSREARLVGLDMQQGVAVAVVTAEAMAAYLGWSEDGVVDVAAVEITDGA